MQQFRILEHGIYARQRQWRETWNEVRQHRNHRAEKRKDIFLKSTILDSFNEEANHPRHTNSSWRDLHIVPRILMEGLGITDAERKEHCVHKCPQGEGQCVMMSARALSTTGDIRQASSWRITFNFPENALRGTSSFPENAGQIR